MSFIKRNIWIIGFVVILGGAFLAMALASKNSGVPSPTGTAKDEVEFTIGSNENTIGPADAKVTIVEFSDFQCPACKAYFPLVEQLVKDFPNDLRLVYRHFPLRSIHPQAQNAALASQAAAKQGKFWEMYREIFENQDSWANTLGKDVFNQYAQNIGLNMEQFQTDINSDEASEKVQANFESGLDINVNSTPTFYVNGKKIDNPQSYAQFKALVEAKITEATQ